MADPRDDRVSSAYRALPDEVPSPALDAAIRAAARRAVGSRPGSSRRWQVPVSIAAVLALAIGVSLQVDRERPAVGDDAPVSAGSAEYPVSPATPEKEARPAPGAPAVTPAAPATSTAPLAKPAPAPSRPQAHPAPEAKRFAADPQPAPIPAASVPPDAALPAAPASPPAPAAIPPAPAQAPALRTAPAAAAPAEAGRAAPASPARMKSEAAQDAATREKPMAESGEAPERSLERIAGLRERGLHEEADRALAEFRRAHPGYRIGDEWLRRVERR